MHQLWKEGTSSSKVLQNNNKDEDKDKGKGKYVNNSKDHPISFVYDDSTSASDLDDQSIC